MGLLRVALEAKSTTAKKKKKGGLNLSKLKKGSFHEWLGKDPGQPITDADIKKGLESKDPHVRRQAQFAKNAKSWQHKKKGTATESVSISLEEITEAINEGSEEIIAETVAEIPADEGVEIKGPLAEAFTDALNTEFAKPEEGQALESQQMEVAIMKKLVEAIHADDTETGEPAIQTVYAVDGATVNDEVIVDVVGEINKAEDTNNLVVVIDGTDGQTNDPINPPTKEIVALECLCRAHGIPVYHSRGEYVAAMLS